MATSLSQAVSEKLKAMKLTINNKEYEVSDVKNKAIKIFAQLKNRYPEKDNVEGLEPALSSDISEAIEKAFEEMVTPVSDLYWEPKMREWYSFLTGNGEISECTWANDFLDYGRLSIGNCFRTKEQAQKHLNYLKALTRVKKYIVEHDLGKEWVYGEGNVCIYYDCEEGELDWYSLSYIKHFSPFGYLKNDKQLLDKFIEDNKQDLLVILGVE